MKAVLLDALGTLVRLEPPAPRLREELRSRTGVDVGADASERGFRAEIGYYLAHHLEGGDPESLEGLRDRCADALAGELPAELPRAAVREAMLASIAFSPYPDAPPALRDLHQRGLRLVVASNWDCSLPTVLEDAGLAPFLDGVVSSATAGAAKPDPAVFVEALRVAGAEPDEAVHVGDSVDNDIEGARAAGMRALLVMREGEPPEGVEAIRSLGELTSLT